MFGNWSNSLDHLVHLLVAFVLALPIGWHRSREEQGAGLRTFPLVAMAACGFVQTGISVLGAEVVNQANILQGVVTGIGFIGAGAIIRQGDFTTGHATAASIWTVGIMGAAVGYGYYDIGIILAAANLAVLMLPRAFIDAGDLPWRMLASARYMIRPAQQKVAASIFDRDKQLRQGHRPPDRTVSRPVIDNECPGGLF